MSDRPKHKESSEEVEGIEVVDQGSSLDDLDLEDVSGGCTNCGNGCSDD